MSRDIDYIVVHCSQSPEFRNDTIEDIRRWHLDRGWSDIGYHLVIHLNGTTHRGRDDDRIGAGVRGFNKKSIHLCYIGGIESEKVGGEWVEKDTRTKMQKAALLDALNFYKNLYPKAKILGHRDFKGVSKFCPSFDAEEEYKHITNKYNHLNIK